MQGREDDTPPTRPSSRLASLLISRLIGGPELGDGEELWRSVIRVERARAMLRLIAPDERMVAVLECGHEIVLSPSEADAAARGEHPETMRCAECELERFAERSA